MKYKTVLFSLLVVVTVIATSFWYQSAVCVFEPNINSDQLVERKIGTICYPSGSGFDFKITDVFYTNTEIIVVAKVTDVNGFHKWFAPPKKLEITARLPELPVKYFIVEPTYGYTLDGQKQEKAIKSVTSIANRLKVATRVNFEFKLEQK